MLGVSFLRPAAGQTVVFGGDWCAEIPHVSTHVLQVRILPHSMLSTLWCPNCRSERRG
jgi:hypothetical protein